MALEKADKSFRLAKISLLDFKSIEMDRVLTALFARIFYRGQDSRLADNGHTVATFLDHFLSQPDKFRGFAGHQRIVQGWLETHLLDLVNRGRPGQEKVAAPRPLHGHTYRFRNPKHCKDYGAAQHIYECLAHVSRGQTAIDRLKDFFFLEGSDPITGQADVGVAIDVETEALRSLTPDEVQGDAPRKDSREVCAPLLPGAAETLADDVIRLLQYRTKIPRSVMVDYLKVLLAFHLSLYHLRLLKELPERVRRRGAGGDDAGPAGLFLDVSNHPGTPVSRLAEQSAELHYRRIPGFVRAYFETKKLDEWAFHLQQTGRLTGGTRNPLSVAEVLALLTEKWAAEREPYFQARMINLKGGMDGDDGALPPQIEGILGMGLNGLDTYVECLMALRGDFQRSFVVRALDSLLLKNRPGALLAQARSKNAPRRFVLDARLLEVLLQISVLQWDAGSGQYRSEEIQIDRLLAGLRERYGLYVDALPRGEGFGEPSIADREALRANKQAFKTKLREIGFFQDLSDAFVTQHVTPRYRIGQPAGGVA